MEGRGTLVASDGSIYEGWFKENRKHGKGRIIHTNGAMFDGQFKEGKRHGLCVNVWQNKER